MTTPADMTDNAALVILPVLASLAVYVWTAASLHALFRKSGEEGWQAWVPILNIVVLLRLGAFSAWWVLLILVPGPGTVALAVIVWMACARINTAFGVGVGMTVVAIVIFPVWSSILGWGSARWLGLEHRMPGPLRSGTPPTGGRRDAAPANPLPGSPFGAAPPAPSRIPPRPEVIPPPRPTMPAGRAASHSAPAAVTRSPSGGPAADTAEDDGHRMPRGGPYTGTVPTSRAPEPPDVPAGPRRAVLPAPSSAADGTADGYRRTGPPAAAPVPAAPVPAAAVPAAAVPAAAVPAAPVPAAAVPAAPVPDAPVPGAPAAEEQSWAPRFDAPPVRTPQYLPPSGDSGFSDTSAEVSAVAGVPSLGAPISARSSVSAAGDEPEIPDAEGAFDETIIATRRRTRWMLTPPLGAPIPVTSDVLIVGRRPSSDPAFGRAQLVAITDETRTMSKTHARLERHDDKWMIIDLDSTNGVVLMTSDGGHAELSPGRAEPVTDCFLLGDAELRLVRERGTE